MLTAEMSAPTFTLSSVDWPAPMVEAEVANWIKQAESRLAYLTTTVERLKAENAGLRKAHKVMEARVMGQSQE